MTVPMMRVRYVRMVVHEVNVSMRVRMGFARRIVRPVAVPMMFVVLVEVLVLECFMLVNVPMAFAQEENDAEPHRDHRRHVWQTQWFVVQDERKDGTHERRRREVGCLASRSNEPQSIGVQNDADAVAYTAEQKRKQEKPKRRDALLQDGEPETDVHDAGNEGFDPNDGERVAQG